MEGEASFGNAENWRGSSNKFGLTFKQIILMHINRCVLKGSVEWHGGYWNKLIKENQTEKYYVQNSRDVFINSVTILKSILKGYYDKKMVESDKDIEEELNKITKENETLEESNQNIKQFYKKKLDIYLRLFEELVMLSKRLNFFEAESTEEEI